MSFTNWRPSLVRNVYPELSTPRSEKPLPFPSLPSAEAADPSLTYAARLPEADISTWAGASSEPALSASPPSQLRVVPEPVIWCRKSILFSACNEDSRSELRAFGSLAGQNVICVTAGGGRVLNLLLDRPAKIVAVDLNPAQNALLELKISAIKELEYVPYLEFLGVRPSVDRLQVYQKLRPLLSDDAQGFLDANADAVEAGVLFQGKLERYLALTAKLTRLAHPFGLGTVLKAQDLEEQRRAIDRWDSVLFRSLVQTLCRRSVLSRLSGDPGFYTSLPADLCLHKVLYNRVFDYLRQHRLRDNPLLQIVFYGRYVWEPALPIYLHAETFASVRRCLAEVKIDIVTGTMAEVLAARRGFDAFSLSDISSYLSSEECHKLFERVLRNARPGARICSRANIYHRPLAAEHARRLVRNQALERDLALHDHSCVHEFVVGSVR